jgi:hypothetical protein
MRKGLNEEKGRERKTEYKYRGSVLQARMIETTLTLRFAFHLHTHSFLECSEIEEQHAALKCWDGRWVYPLLHDLFP